MRTRRMAIDAILLCLLAAPACSSGPQTGGAGGAGGAGSTSGTTGGASTSSTSSSVASSSGTSTSSTSSSVASSSSTSTSSTSSSVASSSSSSSTGGPTWDWVGVVGTGQSLSVGGQATGFNATQQPYHNLKLSLGNATVPPFNAVNAAFSMVPLVEPIRPLATTYPSAYPENIYGETPHTAMANQISALFKTSPGGDYATAHTVVGESGQAMSVIQKGATATMTGAMSTGRAYAATLFEASAIKNLATAAGKTYGVGAIVLTHGESDAGNTGYEAAMVTLWSDYNQDLSAITGQTAKIPMLVSQYHSGFSAGVTAGPTPAMLAQWQVGVDHPGDIICSGPKYQYPYFTDNTHLTSHGYDLLGEKYGEVYYEKVALGHDWQPLQPTGVQRNGNVVTVTLNVPAPPLVWDSTLPAPHQTKLTQWAAGRGFEVSANNAPLTITSVAISGNTVEITCSAAVPAGAVVGYAATTDGAARAGGPPRWGLLRDSDAVVGAVTGTAQPNYCVAFQMTAP